jgi:hypothetical protein
LGCNPDDCLSTTTYVFSLASEPITWACKKQQDLALASTNEEYQATINAI